MTWDDAAIARLRALWNEGLPGAEIATRLDMHEDALRTAVRRFKLPKRRAGQNDRKELTADQAALLRRMWGEGVLIREIAAALGCGATWVQRNAGRHGCAPRARVGLVVEQPQSSTPIRPHGPANEALPVGHPATWALISDLPFPGHI